MGTLMEKIISIINHTEDDDLLHKIYRFLKEDIIDQGGSFSESQVGSILKAKDQFENRIVKSQEEIDSRYKEWIKK